MRHEFSARTPTPSRPMIKYYEPSADTYKVDMKALCKRSICSTETKVKRFAVSFKACVNHFRALQEKIHLRGGKRRVIECDEAPDHEARKQVRDTARERESKRAREQESKRAREGR